MKPLAEIKRNFVKAMSGSTLVTAFNFVALTINTNALGLVLFGQLIVIQAIAEFAIGVFDLNVWQSMNKAGAADLAESNFSRMRRRFYFAFALDLTAGTIAAISSVTAIYFWGDALGLDDSLTTLAMFYAVAAGLQIRGASMGVFTLTDRFGLMLGLLSVEAAALVINAGLLAIVDAPLTTYIFNIAVIQLVFSIAMLLFANHHLRRLEHSAGKREDVRFDRRDFIAFSLAVAANGTVTTVLRRGETLIVSAILGPLAASLYGVAFRVAHVLARFTEMARISVYPVISKLVGAGDLATAKSTVRGATIPVIMLSIAIFLAAAIFGKFALGLVFGDEFSAAYGPMLLLLFGTLTGGCLFAAVALIEIELGAKRMLIFSCISLIFFFVGAFVGIPALGLAGAGIGSAAFAVSLAGLTVWQQSRIASRS